MPTETPGLTLDSKTFDNKLWVQSTARPIGTFTCFTSEGDSTSNSLSIGGGTRMIYDHNISDSTSASVYVDFNVKENKTYISRGIAMYKDCLFDNVCLSVVPTLTSYTDGTNTNYNLYGGYLIIPAPGNGTIDVQAENIKLVEIPFSIDEPDKRQCAAYWDADYSTETHTFSNIRPDWDGTGQYNIFGAEINLETVASVALLGSGNISLQTTDVAEFCHNMRLKYNFCTSAPDHDWQCAINLTISRIVCAKTC